MFDQLDDLTVSTVLSPPLAVERLLPILVAALGGDHATPGAGLGWRMASLQTLERCIAALEARLADGEGGYGNTLHKLHRASVKSDLRTARILERLEIEDVPDEVVDHALDEQ